MELVIKTESLTKIYNKKTVVNNVSMNVYKGDIYGFIGRNGAGKTTAMRLILGLANPNSGSIELFGNNNLNKGRAKIGSIIESPGLYKDMSAYENMKKFATIYGAKKSEIKGLLEFVGLGDVKGKKAGQFSLGMKQRLGIAIAMLGNPEVMILDEPINGLDPAGIKEIRDLILKLNQERGVTFLISSHLLDELAKITTRYGIINEGILVEEISAEELHKRCDCYIEIKTSDNDEAIKILSSKIDKEYLSISGDVIKLNKTDIDTSILIETLILNKIKVYELSNKSIDLESYFIERI